MDMSEICRLEQAGGIDAAIARGLEAIASPAPLSLERWARRHFYLSAESSYVEQDWDPWPFQRAIMACISCDDIREVDWQKAARTGNTKIMLAALCYFAEHKRRNQALWQPTDDDRDEFVKTELDPALRDIAIMRRVFPAYLQRHRDNTLQGKRFLGSMLHLRGAKAAKNFRRISIDVAYLDEADACDNDVEKEGDPPTLILKRLEGATFPKFVLGSTPKLAGFSLVAERVRLADARFRFVVPCPGCGEHAPITWGGKDATHGFKWLRGENGEHLCDTVRHLCGSCGYLMTQAEYLGVWQRGYYLTDDGQVTLTVDDDGDPVFRNRAGERIAPLAHVAFLDVWTAYSPAANWVQIVRDFVAAHEKAQAGDKSKLKAFTNTTLGLPWKEIVEALESNELKANAEPFPLRSIPRGVLMLLAGIDTQDNRLEVVIWGYGRGGEMWTIDHRVLFGSPSEDAVWAELEELLFETEYRHAYGAMRVYAAAIDTGGHHTHAVYEFARRHRARRVFAVRGVPGRERAITHGASVVDIDWRGQRRKGGVVLWHVGTNLAKDLIYGRMQNRRPGPGYMHLSSELSDEFFEQLAGEARVERDGPHGRESRWMPLRKRVEAKDCTVYAVWLETHLELARKAAAWWDRLEELVEPRQPSLLDMPAPAAAEAPAPEVLASPASSPPRVPAPVRAAGRPSAPRPVATAGGRDW